MNRTYYRLQQFTVDAPALGTDPFLHLVIQKIVKNEAGETVQVIDRYHQVHRRMSDTFNEASLVFDPVLRKSVLMTVAGVAMCVRTIALQWMQEQFGGEIIGTELLKIEEK